MNHAASFALIVSQIIFNDLSIMLSARQRITLQKIIPYTLIWSIGALVYIVLEKGIVGDSLYYPSTELVYSFKNGFKITLPLALLGGTLLGIIEVLIVREAFQKLSFGFKIIIKAIVYMLIMMLVLFTISFVNNSVNLNLPLWDSQVINEVYGFFQTFTFWSVMIYGVFLTVFVQFFSEVSDSLGVNQLKNFFAGTYHKPQEEERIFMFLDLRGSTTMAEKLGHSTYFRLLQQFFSDISDPIVNGWGEIYQYVGDEVVVSWPKYLGLKNNNCVECFFQCKGVILERSKDYEAKFGAVPEFKAGIHLGKVAIGEVGVVKRDILFSGDVLNTTARIQSMCNELGVDLLISEDLYSQLSGKVEVNEMIECQLRGKNTATKLLNLTGL